MAQRISWNAGRNTYIIQKNYRITNKEIVIIYDEKLLKD